MATAEAASDPNAPRYAPDDPTLPAPWKGLIDGSTGLLYYWNPDTNVTQYERPAAPGPPLPLGPPPAGTIPKLSPIPAVQSATQSIGMQQSSLQTTSDTQKLHQDHAGTFLSQVGKMGQPQHQMSQPQPLLTQQTAPQRTPQQQHPLHQMSQQLPVQQTQQLPPYQQQQQIPNQQLNPQQFHNMQMPYQQFPFVQGQQQTAAQFSYQTGPQPQVLQAVYNESQPQHGARYPQNNQNQQQTQFSHPQGLQINPQSEKMNQDPQVTHHPGQSLQPITVGSQQGQVLHGQEGGYPKLDDAASADGKPPGFSIQFPQQASVAQSNQRLPSNYQSSDVPPPMNMPSVRSPKYSSRQPFDGASPNDAANMNTLVPLRQGPNDARYQHQQVGGFTGPAHPGPSPTRPPVGFSNSDDDRLGRMVNENHPLGRGGGASMAFHPPNLAPIPLSRGHQETRSGPPFAQPSHEFNMGLPPHPGQNMYSQTPFSNVPHLQPLPRTFPPRDLQDVPTADAYCRQHEVSVIGENIPPPLMTFEDTGFPPEILREIQLAGFLAPTPIQAQTWPVALQNRDIVAIAKTGSGKTLGYLIPAFIHLRRCRNNSQIGPTVLVLAPTRELATQIQDEAIKFGRSSRISCTCLSGGNSKGLQLRELERGADIVVATPGRLNDILEMKKIDFRQVSLLVLDEADRMLDMGFEPQIRKIVNEIPPKRQTLMYTATWPKEVRKIASDLLINPVQVNIGSIDELVANKAITQYIEVVSPMDKERRLEQILRAQERGSRIIIFCSTKRLCDQLARGIGRAFGAAAIHGDKSQAERDHVLNQFRTGRAPILVATDVAARGLDIKDIRVVINYDFPTGIEDYVHRIGRTGRAGATGVAYTFFSEQDWKHASDLVKVLEGADQPVPQELREMAARSGPVVQRYPVEGVKPFDVGGGRFEPAGAGGRGGIRDGPTGYGRRDGPSGFGGRDGPAGFGGQDGPGGFGGRDGPGRFAAGDFGSREAPGVVAYGGRDGLAYLGGRDGPGGLGGREGHGSFRGRDVSGGYGGRGAPVGFGGRDAPVGYGREGPAGYGGRDGPASSGFGGRGGRGAGGFGGRGGHSPGGYGGRGSRVDMYAGRGQRGRGFQGGPAGRGRSDRGPGDRYISDGRGGRYGSRRGFGDRVRGRSISRSPERGRGRSYDSRSRSRGRSYSRSRSRSRGRSYSRSRSPSRSRSWSRSRSRSRSRDATANADSRPRRASLFDVPPPTVQASDSAAVGAASQLTDAPTAVVDELAAPPVSAGGENGSLPSNFDTGGQLEAPGGAVPEGLDVDQPHEIKEPEVSNEP